MTVITTDGSKLLRPMDHQPQCYTITNTMFTAY